VKQKQINCKDFKEIVVDALYNYDELSKTDKRLFRAHLTSCPACAGEYEEIAEVLALMDQRQKPEMGEEFWDSYYPRLLEKIKKQEKVPLIKSFSGGSRGAVFSKRAPLAAGGKMRRWMLYPVAALLLVVIGIIIGRYLYLPSVPGEGEKLISSTLSSERKISPVVAEHFETLRPMLIDCANYNAQENGSGEDFVLIDKKTLKQLVLQNLLLKRIAARGNDVVLTRLLEELELILLELSNAEPGGSNSDIAGDETIGRIRDILKENDTLFKMKVYNKSADNRNVQLKI
jgi:hypothetical protein